MDDAYSARHNDQALTSMERERDGYRKMIHRLDQIHRAGSLPSYADLVFTLHASIKYPADVHVRRFVKHICLRGIVTAGADGMLN